MLQINYIFTNGAKGVMQYYYQLLSSCVCYCYLICSFIVCVCSLHSLLQIIDWFEQYAEEFFETHTEIGESLEVAQALITELLEFEESTKVHTHTVIVCTTVLHSKKLSNF